MHKTRILPIELLTVDDFGRREAVAFRVHCTCGYRSSVPLLSQGDANREAREHREMYSDASVSEAEA
jgi:hypothetical protein